MLQLNLARFRRIRDRHSLVITRVFGCWATTLRVSNLRLKNGLRLPTRSAVSTRPVRCLRSRCAAGQLPFFIEYLKQGGLFDGWET